MFYSAFPLLIMKVVGSGNQHPMVGCSTNAPPLPTTADISTLDDSSYKVGRLSAEERKEKINRYMRKRNERNFSKKIKVNTSMLLDFRVATVCSDLHFLN